MKVKIAIVTNSLSLGGAERISVLLAEWLNSKGYEVAIITLKRDNKKIYEVNPKIKRMAINGENGSSSFDIILNLRRTLKEYNPSLILVMGVPLSIYTVPASLGLSIPLIVSERNDPAHFAGRKITKFLSRFLMRYAKGFVFQTNEAMNYYSKSIRNKGIVIPNPLTSSNLPEPYKGVRRKRVVTVGRLVPQKNHELLISAFKEIVSEFPEYTLTIYGEGIDRPKLSNKINEEKLSNNVFLPGEKSNIYSEIIDAELFVLSSDFEGMPNVLIEAMALGLPVISTDCSGGGASSLIEDRMNGVLVPVGNKDEMVSAMKAVLLNKEFAKLIGENAIEIRERLNSDKVCNQWFEYFLKTINEN